MARTINGNHTGAAAHGQDELSDLRLARTEQDVRIGKKIRRLHDLMEGDFLEWYAYTPFASDPLEQALDGKLAELEARDESDLS